MQCSSAVLDMNRATGLGSASGARSSSPSTMLSVVNVYGLYHNNSCMSESFEFYHKGRDRHEGGNAWLKGLLAWSISAGERRGGGMEKSNEKLGDVVEGLVTSRELSAVVVGVPALISIDLIDSCHLGARLTTGAL